MYFTIDVTLLCFFEKRAHWFQRLTGKDNFWLGWIFYWLSPLVELYRVYSGESSPVKCVINGTGTMIAATCIALLLRGPLAYIRSKLGYRARNPFEKSLIGIIVRMWLVIAVSMFILFLFTRQTDYDRWLTAEGTCALVAFYLFSCTPLRPEEIAIAPGVLN